MFRNAFLKGEALEPPPARSRLLSRSCCPPESGGQFATFTITLIARHYQNVTAHLLRGYDFDSRSALFSFLERTNHEQISSGTVNSYCRNFYFHCRDAELSESRPFPNSA